MSEFVEVGPPYWDDTDVFVIGGGASLDGFPFEALRGRGVTIGVNVAGPRLNTDVCFSLDHNFPRQHKEALEAYIERGGEAWLAMAPGRKVFPVAGAHYIERRRGDLATHPREVFGHSSGFGALNFAVHKRARRVYLLGIDMAVEKSGRTHWHDAYGTASLARKANMYNRWAENFSRSAARIAALGIEVINVVGSPLSHVTCFPTLPQAELLASMEAAA